VATELGAMDRAAEEFRFQVAAPEVVGPRAGRFADVRGRRRLASDRILPVRAEVTDVLSSGGIDDQDSFVAVSVGDAEQVGVGVDAHVGRQKWLRRSVDAAAGIVAVWPFSAGPSDLIDERAVRLELQHLRVVAEVRRPRKLSVKILARPVAGDVDEIVVVDEDPVFAGRPEAAVLLAALVLQKSWIRRPAPGLQQVARLVELKDRRRRETAPGHLTVRTGVTDGADRIAVRVLAGGAERAGVGRVERARTVIDPDVVVPIDEQPADVADDPVVRQRFRPAWINDEARGRRARGRVRGGPLPQAFNRVGFLQGIGRSVFTLRTGAASHTAYRAKYGNDEAAPAPRTGRRHQAAAVVAVESTLPNTSVAFRISSIVPIEIRAWV